MKKTVQPLLLSFLLCISLTPADSDVADIVNVIEKEQSQEIQEVYRQKRYASGRLPMSGCYASSEFSDVYSCSKALDGDLNTDFATNGEGEGAWIQVIFGGTFVITSMQIANRATGSEPELEMNKEIQLTFSDGYTTKVTLAGSEMTGKLQTFTFDKRIEAPTVRIKTLSVYSKNNNGYAEIAFFGKKIEAKYLFRDD